MVRFFRELLICEWQVYLLSQPTISVPDFRRAVVCGVCVVKRSVPAAATENRVRERAAGFSRWSVCIAGIAVTSPGPEYTTVSTLFF